MLQGQSSKHSVGQQSFSAIRMPIQEPVESVRCIHATPRQRHPCKGPEQRPPMNNSTLHPFVAQQISQYESDLEMTMAKVARARELRDLADAIRWAPTASAIIRWHPGVKGARSKIQRAAEDSGARILKDTLGKLAALESDEARLQRLGVIHQSRLLFSGHAPRLVTLIERETVRTRHQILSRQAHEKGEGDSGQQPLPPANPIKRHKP